MFEVMLTIQMIEIRSHVWSEHGQNFVFLVNTSSSSSFELVVADTLVFEKIWTTSPLKSPNQVDDGERHKTFLPIQAFLFDASR